MTGNGFAQEDLEIAGTVWDIPFATSSQTAANSRNSCLREASSAVSASRRYLAACSRR